MLWTPAEGYFLLDMHLERIRQSAGYFDYAIDPEYMRRRLTARAASLEPRPQRVRMLAAREGTLDIEAEPLEENDRSHPVRVRLAAAPVNSADVFLYHKTTLRKVYEAARLSCADCDDVLLYNERNELTESCIANLVLEMNGELLTPPVDSGLLAGTYRAWLLRQGKIRECVIKVESLRKCSRIYLINSVGKWREARLI
jgi:para-aminobenzoate synthetase/4-amino-4-deoxychorismate lyase